jgi:hypothetical protein
MPLAGGEAMPSVWVGDKASGGQDEQGGWVGSKPPPRALQQQPSGSQRSGATAGPGHGLRCTAKHNARLSSSRSNESASSLGLA